MTQWFIMVYQCLSSFFTLRLLFRVFKVFPNLRKPQYDIVDDISRAQSSGLFYAPCSAHLKPDFRRLNPCS